MPLQLLIHTSDSAAPREITFDAPRVVIGRGKSSDLCLPDPSVSHRHASIRQRGSDYIVMDEGSTNGTFVGPVKLSQGAPRVLNSGDRLKIGRIAIDTKLTMNPPPAHSAIATREIALGLVAAALSAQGEANAPQVRISEGSDAGKTLTLEQFQRAYVIGRLHNADLVLDEADASRRHVSLQRRGDQLWVQDLGSKNGTRLDDAALESNKEVVWPSGATLRIGSDVLHYEDPVKDALQELEQLPDEAVAQEELLANSAPAGSTEPPKPASRAPRARASQRPAPALAPRGWTLSDLLVALLALAVLAVSGLGLYWMLGGAH